MWRWHTLRGRAGCDTIELMTGAFDDPAAVLPAYQAGTESKLGWTDGIAVLPGGTTEENSGLGGAVHHIMAAPVRSNS